MDSLMLTSDFLSERFDPVAALLSPNLTPPCTRVRVFHNLEEYVRALNSGTDFEPVSFRKSAAAKVPNGTVQENNLDAAKHQSTTAEKQSKSSSEKLKGSNEPEPKKSKTKLLRERRERLQALMKSELEMSKPKIYHQPNIIQKMDKMKEGPFSVLYNCMHRGTKLRVWTRRYKGIRGICCGYLVAFDKHMNLAMIDVEEVYTLETRTLAKPGQKVRGSLKNLEKSTVREEVGVKEVAESEKYSSDDEQIMTSGADRDCNIKSERNDDLETIMQIPVSQSVMRENIDIQSAEVKPKFSSASVRLSPSLDKEGKELAFSSRKLGETMYDSERIPYEDTKRSSMHSECSTFNITTCKTESDDCSALSTVTFSCAMSPIPREHVKHEPMETDLIPSERFSDKLKACDGLLSTSLSLKESGNGLTPHESEIDSNQELQSGKYVEPEREASPSIGKSVCSIEDQTIHCEVTIAEGENNDQADAPLHSSSGSLPLVNERQKNVEGILACEDKGIFSMSTFHGTEGCGTDSLINCTSEKGKNGSGDERTSDIFHDVSSSTQLTPTTCTEDINVTQTALVSFTSSIEEGCHALEVLLSKKTYLEKEEKVGNISDTMDLEIIKDNNIEATTGVQGETVGSSVNPNETLNGNCHSHILEPMDVSFSSVLPESVQEYNLPNILPQISLDVRAGESVADAVTTTKAMRENIFNTIEVSFGKEKTVDHTQQHFEGQCSYSKEQIVEFLDEATGQKQNLVVVGEAIPLEIPGVRIDENKMSNQYSLKQTVEQDVVLPQVIISPEGTSELCTANVNGNLVVEGHMLDLDGQTKLFSHQDVVFELGEAIPLDIEDMESAGNVVAKLNIEELQNQGKLAPILPLCQHGGSEVEMSECEEAPNSFMAESKDEFGKGDLVPCSYQSNLSEQSRSTAQLFEDIVQNPKVDKEGLGIRNVEAQCETETDDEESVTIVLEDSVLAETEDGIITFIVEEQREDDQSHSARSLVECDLNLTQIVEEQHLQQITGAPHSDDDVFMEKEPNGAVAQDSSGAFCVFHSDESKDMICALGENCQLDVLDLSRNTVLPSTSDQQGKRNVRESLSITHVSCVRIESVDKHEAELSDKANSGVRDSDTLGEGLVSSLDSKESIERELNCEKGLIIQATKSEDKVSCEDFKINTLRNFLSAREELACAEKCSDTCVKPSVLETVSPSSSLKSVREPCLSEDPATDNISRDSYCCEKVSLVGNNLPSPGLNCNLPKEVSKSPNHSEAGNGNNTSTVKSSPITPIRDCEPPMNVECDETWLSQELSSEGTSGRARDQNCVSVDCEENSVEAEHTCIPATDSERNTIVNVKNSSNQYDSDADVEAATTESLHCSVNLSGKEDDLSMECDNFTLPGKSSDSDSVCGVKKESFTASNGDTGPCPILTGSNDERSSQPIDNLIVNGKNESSLIASENLPQGVSKSSELVTAAHDPGTKSPFYSPYPKESVAVKDENRSFNYSSVSYSGKAVLTEDLNDKKVKQRMKESLYDEDELFNEELDYNEEIEDIPVSSALDTGDEDKDRNTLNTIQADSNRSHGLRITEGYKDETQNGGRRETNRDSLSEGELTSDSESNPSTVHKSETTHGTSPSGGVIRPELIFPIFTPSEKKNIWFVEDSSMSCTKMSDRVTTFVPIEDISSSDSLLVASTERDVTDHGHSSQLQNEALKKRGRGNFKYFDLADNMKRVSTSKERAGSKDVAIEELIVAANKSDCKQAAPTESDRKSSIGSSSTSLVQHSDPQKSHSHKQGCFSDHTKRPVSPKTASSRHIAANSDNSTLAISEPGVGRRKSSHRKSDIFDLRKEKKDVTLTVSETKGSCTLFENDTLVDTEVSGTEYEKHNKKKKKKKRKRKDNGSSKERKNKSKEGGRRLSSDHKHSSAKNLPYACDVKTDNATQRRYPNSSSRNSLTSESSCFSEKVASRVASDVSDAKSPPVEKMKAKEHLSVVSAKSRSDDVKEQLLEKRGSDSRQDVTQRAETMQRKSNFKGSSVHSISTTDLKASDKGIRKSGDSKYRTGKDEKISKESKRSPKSLVTEKRRESLGVLNKSTSEDNAQRTKTSDERDFSPKSRSSSGMTRDQDERDQRVSKKPLLPSHGADGTHGKNGSESQKDSSTESTHPMSRHLSKKGLDKADKPHGDGEKRRKGWKREHEKSVLHSSQGSVQEQPACSQQEKKDNRDSRSQSISRETSVLSPEGRLHGKKEEKTRLPFETRRRGTSSPKNSYSELSLRKRSRYKENADAKNIKSRAYSGKLEDARYPKPSKNKKRSYQVTKAILVPSTEEWVACSSYSAESHKPAITPGPLEGSVSDNYMTSNSHINSLQEGNECKKSPAKRPCIAPLDIEKMPENYSVDEEAAEKSSTGHCLSGILVLPSVKSEHISQDERDVLDRESLLKGSKAESILKEEKTLSKEEIREKLLTLSDSLCKGGGNMKQNGSGRALKDGTNYSTRKDTPSKLGSHEDCVKSSAERDRKPGITPLTHSKNRVTKNAKKDEGMSIEREIDLITTNRDSKGSLVRREKTCKLQGHNDKSKARGEDKRKKGSDEEELRTYSVFPLDKDHSKKKDNAKKGLRSEGKNEKKTIQTGDRRKVKTSSFNVSDSEDGSIKNSGKIELRKEETNKLQISQCSTGSSLASPGREKGNSGEVRDSLSRGKEMERKIEKHMKGEGKGRSQENQQQRRDSSESSRGKKAGYENGAPFQDALISPRSQGIKAATKKGESVPVQDSIVSSDKDDCGMKRNKHGNAKSGYVRSVDEDSKSMCSKWENNRSNDEEANHMQCEQIKIDKEEFKHQGKIDKEEHHSYRKDRYKNRFNEEGRLGPPDICSTKSRTALSERRAGRESGSSSPISAFSSSSSSASSSLSSSLSSSSSEELRKGKQRKRPSHEESVGKEEERKSCDRSSRSLSKGIKSSKRTSEIPKSVHKGLMPFKGDYSGSRLSTLPNSERKDRENRENRSDGKGNNSPSHLWTDEGKSAKGKDRTTKRKCKNKESDSTTPMETDGKKNTEGTGKRDRKIEYKEKDGKAHVKTDGKKNTEGTGKSDHERDCKEKGNKTYMKTDEKNSIEGKGRDNHKRECEKKDSSAHVRTDGKKSSEGKGKKDHERESKAKDSKAYVKIDEKKSTEGKRKIDCKSECKEKDSTAYVKTDGKKSSERKGKRDQESESKEKDSKAHMKTDGKKNTEGKGKRDHEREFKEKDSKAYVKTDEKKSSEGKGRRDHKSNSKDKDTTAHTDGKKKTEGKGKRDYKSECQGKDNTTHLKTDGKNNAEGKKRSREPEKDRKARNETKCLNEDGRKRLEETTKLPCTTCKNDKMRENKEENSTKDQCIEVERQRGKDKSEAQMEPDNIDIETGREGFIDVTGAGKTMTSGQEKKTVHVYSNHGKRESSHTSKGKTSHKVIDHVTKLSNECKSGGKRLGLSTPCLDAGSTGHLQMGSSSRIGSPGKHKEDRHPVLRQGSSDLDSQFEMKSASSSTTESEAKCCREKESNEHLQTDGGVSRGDKTKKSAIVKHSSEAGSGSEKVKGTRRKTKKEDNSRSIEKIKKIDRKSLVCEETDYAKRTENRCTPENGKETREMLRTESGGTVITDFKGASSTDTDNSFRLSGHVSRSRRKSTDVDANRTQLLKRRRSDSKSVEPTEKEMVKRQRFLREGYKSSSDKSGGETDSHHNSNKSFRDLDDLDNGESSIKKQGFHQNFSTAGDELKLVGSGISRASLADKVLTQKQRQEGGEHMEGNEEQTEATRINIHAICEEGNNQSGRKLLDNRFLSFSLPRRTTKAMKVIQSGVKKGTAGPSTTFEPLRPLEGHIFRKRHINQLFIRGDNVVMVACDHL